MSDDVGDLRFENQRMRDKLMTIVERGDEFSVATAMLALSAIPPRPAWQEWEIRRRDIKIKDLEARLDGVANQMAFVCVLVGKVKRGSITIDEAYQELNAAFEPVEQEIGE